MREVKVEKDVDMLHVKVKKVRGGGDGGDRRSGDVAQTSRCSCADQTAARCL